MAKRACAMCRHERDEEKMKIFPVSAEDKVLLRSMGEENPPDQYAYCKNCVNLLSNQSTAIPLIKGTVQVNARASGVHPTVAEKAADSFVVKLSKLSTKT